MKDKNLNVLICVVMTVTLTLILASISPSFCSELNNVDVLSCRGLNAEYFYVVFGEIYNKNAYAIKNVKVEVQLKDKNGAEIGEVNATSSLSIIPPKRRSPFIAYFSGEQRNQIQDVKANSIYFDNADPKPEALALVYYYYNSSIGTFTTHVLNNSTMKDAKGSTNYIKVVATLYAGEKIVATSAGFLTLEEPGLLWDTDTTIIGNGEPISVDFAAPFLENEIITADKLVASVESREFSAQEEIVGRREEENWIWTRSDIENQSNHADNADQKDGGNSWLKSLATIVILIIIGVIISVTLYIRKRHSRLHTSKRRRKK